MPISNENAPLTQSLALIVGLGLVCLLAGWVYQPGIGGVFLLDDTPNLAPLSDFTQAPSWESARHLLLNGVQGPLGRPISMASFLAEANDWPDNPARFRQTNILLHIANGLLLFLLLHRVTRGAYRHPAWIALALTGLWLLHPLHTTTTLYIVQRMTLLAAFFSLGAMWIYVVGRDFVSNDRPKLGITLMAGAVGLGIGMGSLSKENAVLIPIFLLALETTILARSSPRTKLFRTSRTVILGLPILALTLYITYRWPDFQNTYLARTFDMPERLMTEARVLVDYLHTILLPRLAAISIFHDAYPVSRGLFSPPSTIFSIVLILGLLASAWIARLRHPVLAFGIIWFLGGHLLESTVVPLELYFEHRNYLPSIGILACVLYLLIIATRRFTRLITVCSILALAAVFSWQTMSASRDWGNPVRAATIWPAEHPNSERAQQMAASIWIRAKRYPKAEQALTEAATRNPRHSLLWLQVAQIKCLQGRDPLPAIAQADFSKQSIAINKSDLDTLDSLRELARLNSCNGISPTLIHQVAGQLLSLPASMLSDNHRSYARFIKARAYADDGLTNDAVQLLDEAIQFNPNVRYRFWQVTWFLSANKPDAAQAYLSLAERELVRQQRPHPQNLQELSTLKRMIAAVKREPKPDN